MAWNKRDNPLGELDGEHIDAATVKVSGSGTIDRRLEEGERIVVVVEGVVGVPSFKRSEGQLVRVQPLKVETVAEPGDMLAVEVAEFLELVEEEQSGKAKLPLEDDDDDPPTDGKTKAAGE